MFSVLVSANDIALAGPDETALFEVSGNTSPLALIHFMLQNWDTIGAKKSHRLLSSLGNAESLCQKVLLSNPNHNYNKPIIILNRIFNNLLFQGKLNMKWKKCQPQQAGIIPPHV